jgi:hypothetical protein
LGESSAALYHYLVTVDRGGKMFVSKSPFKIVNYLLAFMLILASFSSQLNVQAQPDEQPGRGALSLDDLLLPDGRLDLDTGFSGALDTNGWQMDLAADGSPLFSPVSEPTVPLSSANTWSDVGNGPGGTVNAIYIEGPNVYVGGSFSNAGSNPNADGIARWDGTNWHALGTGTSGGVVYAIAVVGEDVYAGGLFLNMGGVSTADYLARWDGTAWYGVGSPILSSWVQVLVADGHNLYVGGNFTNAGGQRSEWHSSNSGSGW